MDSYFSYQTDDVESDEGTECCVNSAEHDGDVLQVPATSCRKGEPPPTPRATIPSETPVPQATPFPRAL